MNAELVLKLGKKIVFQLLVLGMILLIVLIATGVPTNFNVYYEYGQYHWSMTLDEVKISILDNIKGFISGEIFSVKIASESIGIIFRTAFVLSLKVLLGGTLLALALGIPKGVLDSQKKGQQETFKLLQSYIPLSIPDVLTVGLIQFGAIYLYYNDMTFLGLGPIHFIGDESWVNTIYPIISISILPAAYISRITASTIETLYTKQYIVTARGKGCSFFQVLKNHMMKNIIFEILSSAPTIMAMMFSSLLIIERLFFYRGVGFHLIFFFISDHFAPEQARASLTVFIMGLALFYYILFLSLRGLNAWILPKIEER
jgi:ABC-type dipeptide/oligopeptide/nickel transport system permease component